MKKLPQYIAQDIIQKNAEGYSYEQLQAHLQDKHSLAVTRPAIIKLLSEHKEEIAKASSRSALVNAVPMALAVLGKILNDEVAEYDNPNATLSERRAAQKEIRCICKLVLDNAELAPSDKPEEIAGDQYLEDLAKAFKKIDPATPPPPALPAQESILDPKT